VATAQRLGADIVASGGIGEIRFVRIWDFRYRPVDPYIKRSKDQSLFAPELIDWPRFLGRAPKRPYDAKRASGWRWYWDYAGGLMTDIGPHWLDVAMWITGSDGPRSVSSNGGKYQNLDWETPDNVHAILDCGTFSIVFMVQFMNGQEYDGAAFYGLEGSIAQENQRGMMVRYDAKRKEVESWKVVEESTAHMQNFLDCMRSRQLNWNSGDIRWPTSTRARSFCSNSTRYAAKRRCGRPATGLSASFPKARKRSLTR
jgi:predicted dehydrogenase